MNVLNELKEKRQDAIEMIAGVDLDLEASRLQMAEEQHIRQVWVDRIRDLDTAIAALEPAPPTPVISTADGFEDPISGCWVPTVASETADVEIPEGFTKWEGGECPVQYGTRVAVFYRQHGSEEAHEWESHGKGDTLETWAHDGSGGDIIAYRVIYQPADQSEEAPACTCHPDDNPPVPCPQKYATRDCWAAAGRPDPYGEVYPHTDGAAITDDLRTAEGEPITEDDRIETQSVTSDPDFVAAVSRAEATLASEPAYIGLQDADLDAEFDAMKARETKAARGKFGIWGGKREKVDA